MNKTAIAAPLLLMAVAVSGCATTMNHAELTASTKNMQVWQVDAPSKQVFRDYKDLIQRKIDGSWLSDESGMEWQGAYYGPEAELSLGLMSNLLLHAEYLHFDMDGSDGQTTVKVWYLNDKWESRLAEYKALLPTVVTND